jgi:hypothetical protein
LSDEATIGVSGIINRHRCWIWGSCAPPNTRNVTVNVYYALASAKVIGLMKPYA